MRLVVAAELGVVAEAPAMREFRDAAAAPGLPQLAVAGLQPLLADPAPDRGAAGAEQAVQVAGGDAAGAGDAVRRQLRVRQVLADIAFDPRQMRRLHAALLAAQHAVVLLQRQGEQFHDALGQPAMGAGPGFRQALRHHPQHVEQQGADAAAGVEGIGRELLHRADMPAQQRRPHPQHPQLVRRQLGEAIGQVRHLDEELLRPAGQPDPLLLEMQLGPAGEGDQQALVGVGADMAAIANIVDRFRIDPGQRDVAQVPVLQLAPEMVRIARPGVQRKQRRGDRIVPDPGPVDGRRSRAVSDRAKLGHGSILLADLSRRPAGCDACAPISCLISQGVCQRSACGRRRNAAPARRKLLCGHRQARAGTRG